ncbi:hypothetical protein BOTBODRAFT_130540 [Botryobasidium botryosum FD-172 SS1]|uniref:Pentatricopeptide repeat-containing protein-mitochondrial domain-containing protein n=1 Tax=Botryobasidium botryosum (strain FD-172 SS1) TaxID=930990 RepID=A0A067MVH1_BOTB1|nr:hypothetical protein BOTBODRAFT_130540 [Botryobasidium botryosum FD-172 SS1]
MLSFTARAAARRPRLHSSRLSVLASSSVAHQPVSCRLLSTNTPAAPQRAEPPHLATSDTPAAPFHFSTPAKHGRTPPREHPVQRINRELHRYSSTSPVDLAGTLNAWNKLKAGKVAPTEESYHLLLQGFAAHGMLDEALTVVEDMQGFGFWPGTTAWNHILYAARYSTKNEHAVLEHMRAERIPFDLKTYEHIITSQAAQHNVEGCLQTLDDMHTDGLVVNFKSIKTAIKLMSHQGCARVAIDLAASYEKISSRRLDVEVWVHILTASAETYYTEGTIQAWDKVVHHFNTTPDEGLCIQVLNVAGRAGLPELATDVHALLARAGILRQEHHYAPLLNSFCTSNRIQEAFAVLSLMRQSSVSILPGTVRPLIEHLKQSVDEVDNAFVALENIKKESNKSIDVAAFNAVLTAAVELEDMQRAVGTYKYAAELGVTPNADTFDTLLRGCVIARNKPLGDRLLTEMRAAGLTLGAGTYEQLVKLCLTQTYYEDAFFYLEEMKGAGFLPSRNVYEAIIRRCTLAKDPRARLAQEEMKQVGYESSRKFLRWLQAQQDAIGADGETANSAGGAPTAASGVQPKANRPAKSTKHTPRTKPIRHIKVHR